MSDTPPTPVAFPEPDGPDFDAPSFGPLSTGPVAFPEPDDSPFTVPSFAPVTTQDASSVPPAFPEPADSPFVTPPAHPPAPAPPVSGDPATKPAGFVRTGQSVPLGYSAPVPQHFTQTGPAVDPATPPSASPASETNMPPAPVQASTPHVLPIVAPATAAPDAPNASAAPAFDEPAAMPVSVPVAPAAAYAPEWPPAAPPLAAHTPDPAPSPAPTSTMPPAPARPVDPEPPQSTSPAAPHIVDAEVIIEAAPQSSPASHTAGTAAVVVVIGCSGRLGSAVTRAFQAHEYLVVGVDLIRPDGTAPDAFVQGDVCDERTLTRAVAEAERHGEIMHVLCLVTEDGVGDPDDTPQMAGIDRLRDVVESRLEPAWLVLSAFEPVLANHFDNRSILVRSVPPAMSGGPAEAAAAGAVEELVRFVARQCAPVGIRIGAVAVPDADEQDEHWEVEPAVTFFSYAVHLRSTTGMTLNADGTVH